MQQNGIDAYIIPVGSPHPGENIPDHWRMLKWLTGFSGSAGIAVVTGTFAGLWTDSRYFIQAEKELDGSGFRLMKQGYLPETGYAEWIAENSETISKTALDGRIFSIASLRKLEAKLAHKKISINFRCDLISGIWTGRPALPSSVSFDHPLKFAGKARDVKISEVREEMKKMEVNYHLLVSCDDVMWLFNIRGDDFTYSPLIMSSAVIGEHQIFLFTDETKIPPDLALEFDKLGVKILAYDKCQVVLAALPEGSRLLVTPGKTPVSLWFSIPGSLRIIDDLSIPSRMKAVKNKTEIENILKVMIRDGVVLTKFFYWIEVNLGVLSLNERSVKNKLLEIRNLQVEFLGPSFETIAAFNANSALPHYNETSETNAEIDTGGILLVDSGGHYMGGTTDITRTISTGVPSLQQKKDFTLVLKGHTGLASARFPLGTRGYQLDILARKALWDNGLNYGHGTGHGVGYCLNVHEGPQNISPADNKTIIQPGMLISNEPAVYREGEYGIRTENLMICYEDEETDFGQFLRFDTVSLCYIDKSLIDKSLLDQKEIDWLNSYHAEVFEKISPHLTDPEKLWLKTKTDPL